MHDGKLDIIVGAFFVEKGHDFQGAENYLAKCGP